VTDGPFPEPKEAIAGYWVIQADSLEEAVEITKGNPWLKYGETVEVSSGCWHLTSDQVAFSAASTMMPAILGSSSTTPILTNQ
jgi:hypothetical protein